MSKFVTVAALLASATALAACSEPSQDSSRSLTGPQVQASAVRFREAGASVQWNAIERDLLIKHTFADQIAAWRQFAYLSLAQYNAVIAAEDAEEDRDEDRDTDIRSDDEQLGERSLRVAGLRTRRATHPSDEAAVAGASAAVLTYFFPDEQAFLDGQVAAQRNGDQTDFAAGEAIGRAVAVQVIASATTDRFSDPWTGTIPVCPGCWHSNSPGLPPIRPQLGQMRPFFLTSGDQFRPAPPPAFGSSVFLAALAEIRHFSDTRTLDQDSIAKFWAFPAGTFLVAGYWNSSASNLIVQFHRNERKAAHTLALMNMAGLDALTASHEAKYYYWLIRPTQSDPLITLSIGLPNHPSYPSNHATVSTTAALILGSMFPSQADRLAALADEAGLSRLYAGIHYRFDKTAGEQIARNVAALALRLDVEGDEPFALKP